MANLKPRTGQVLTGASAATTKGTLDGGGAFRTYNLQVTSNVGVTSGVVTLEGSLDGVTYNSLGTITTSSATTQWLVVVDKPYRYIQARISTIIGGGTVDAWIAAV